MKFGLSIINFGNYSDPHRMIELASVADTAGWDGIFLWDHLLAFYPEPIVPFIDPWVALAAIAARTQNIRLGPMITPLPRRRPWKVAREAVSLDHLSNGRLIFGVGIGTPPEANFKPFGEDTDWKRRAEKLNEALDILMGLWSGKPFSYKGVHYQLKEMTFLPKPVQSPRIPIWGAGAWPRKGGFRRAARLDGIIPMHWNPEITLQPKDFEQIVAYIKRYRRDLSKFDVVASGEVIDTRNARKIIQSYADVGVTWWLEIISDRRGTFEEMRELVLQGPLELIPKKG